MLLRRYQTRNPMFGIKRTPTIPPKNAAGGGNGNLEPRKLIMQDDDHVGSKHARFESEDEEPEVAKQQKKEPLTIGIEQYIGIIAQLNRFKTKTTIWYVDGDAERKRDSNRMALYRLRNNKLSIVYDDETSRDVLANEIDVASRFSALFNSTDAAALYELIDGGVSVNDAVMRVINSQNDVTELDAQTPRRIESAN